MLNYSFTVCHSSLFDLLSGNSATISYTCSDFLLNCKFCKFQQWMYEWTPSGKTVLSDPPPPALPRCISDPSGASEWCHYSLWDMGHCRAGKIPQCHPTLLQRSPRCTPGLWYQQKGKIKPDPWLIAILILSFLVWFMSHCVYLCLTVIIGNIHQSSNVAQRARETVHRRIYCHMAGGQQGRSGSGSASLSGGRDSENIINSIDPNHWTMQFWFMYVITQEGQSLANHKGLCFIETSALLGEQTNELLQSVGK